MKAFKEKYIADWSFYKYAMMIALPMIAQNMITNFVSMLDNVMVGQIGTTSMSGVSIVNQFMFVFNLSVFGGISGASIFGTQFFGKQDPEGQKYTFRFRLILVAILILAGMAIFTFWGDPLISLFLSKDDSPALVAETLQYGHEYLALMVWSLIPFGVGQAYSSGVRECGETKAPMYASLIAIGVNLFLDYGLIFGNFGLPQLGVRGAAIATIIAKTVEALVVILWTHLNPQKFQYIIGVFKGFFIPKDLSLNIIKKGCPLLVNEFLWAFGMTVVAQSYSIRGLEVVAARNVASTLTNLFGVVYIQLGAAIGIIIGMKLGANQFEEARRRVNHLLFLAIIVAVIITIITIPIGFFFPAAYNTDPSIRTLATYFIIITSLATPFCSYSNACYFILRSGGKTGYTFLFDFVFTWCLMIPLAFVLTHFTSMDIHPLLAIVTFTEFIKDIVGYFMVKSDIWMKNIVE